VAGEAVAGRRVHVEAVVADARAVGLQSRVGLAAPARQRGASCAGAAGVRTPDAGAREAVVEEGRVAGTGAADQGRVADTAVAVARAGRSAAAAAVIALYALQVADRRRHVAAVARAGAGGQQY
jgi:hypothetical protein